MKLRIRGNSLRLRLTKSEVEKFAQTGEITDFIEFGIEKSKKMSYSLVSKEDIKQVCADFNNGKISVFIPSNLADEWTQTEQVGLNTKQNLSEGKNLSILIEKDFVCLTKRKDEDESDNFPHPNATEKC